MPDVRSFFSSTSSLPDSRETSEERPVIAVRVSSANCFVRSSCELGAGLGRSSVSMVKTAR